MSGASGATRRRFALAAVVAATLAAALSTPVRSVIWARSSRTIEVTMHHSRFEPSRFVVRRGETVRFVLVNKGEQPHELTIADAAEQAEHRKMMRAMAGMDMASMGHNDPNTVSADPGETKALVWPFTGAGTFEFACNYPGHAEVGMTGKITVK